MDNQKLLIAVDVNGGAQPLAASGEFIESALQIVGCDYEALGFDEGGHPSGIGLYVWDGVGRLTLTGYAWDGTWRIATSDDLDFFGVATAA